MAETGILTKQSHGKCFTSRLLLHNDLFLMAGTGECKAVILEISTARGQIEDLSTGPRGQSYAR